MNSIFTLRAHAAPVFLHMPKIFALPCRRNSSRSCVLQQFRHREFTGRGTNRTGAVAAFASAFSIRASGAGVVWHRSGLADFNRPSGNVIEFF